MRFDFTVSLFQKNFRKFLKEWKYWDPRFVPSNEEEETQIYIRMWKSWFEGFTKMGDENMKKLFYAYSAELKPIFKRIRQRFKDFQKKWILFNKENPCDQSDEHYLLYVKSKKVFENLTVVLKNCK